MKTLLLLFSVLMVGCGGAPGNNETLPIPIGEGPGVDEPTAPGVICKSFNDVWESDLDQERHDFRGLSSGVDYHYTYTGPLGEPCGAPPNQYHAITFRHGKSGHPSVASFDGTITMKYIGGIYPGCQHWWPSGGIDQQYAAYKVECNKLTMCGNDGTANFTLCKTFH